MCGLVTVRATDLNELTDNRQARPSVRFHDLRHFAGTQAARKGYTGRELQARLGHGTARAAMIYQHAVAERDRELAERVGEELAGLLPSTPTGLSDGAAGITAAGRDRRSEPDGGNPVESSDAILTPSKSESRSKSPVARRLPGFSRERMTGIEPAFSAWEADVLPLNYIREGASG